MHHRKSQTLDYRGGVPVSKSASPYRHDQVLEPSVSLLPQNEPSPRILKPNEVKFHYTSKPFIPKYVMYDRCCLKFHGYYKDPLGERGSYSIRKIELVYYLDDDTLVVTEPAIRTPHLPQGKLVGRQKIKKADDTFLRWSDLNLAINLNIFSRTYRLTDCDDWTRDFLASSGIEMNPPEDIPSEPQCNEFICKFGLGDPRIRSAAPDGTGRRPKFRQFLDHDGQVLAFWCVWDRRDETQLRYDERLPKYLLRYYLADNTVEVRSLQSPKSAEFRGHPFEQILYRRQRLPKEPFQTCVTSPVDADDIQYYTPSDFHVGGHISVMGRPFIITECDQFTQNYYRKEFGRNDFSPLNIQA